MIKAFMIDVRNAFRPASRFTRVLLCGAAQFLCVQMVLAGSDAHWTTNYYKVTGSTLHEIRRSMKRNRPAHVEREALTEWTIRTRFGVVKFQDKYRCGGFTTTTIIRMTLPQWTAPEGVSESVRTEWERYLDALKNHELGHAQFALSTAGQLHRRVATMGLDSDPDNLKARVEQLVSETVRAFREREREYDRLTDHGLRQGAQLSFRADRPHPTR